jgi:hypothetical protein
MLLIVACASALSLGAVRIDEDGWTVVDPSPDSGTVYVSPDGDDTADGRTEATAVQTLATGIGLLRDGRPDRMLLQRGGVWHERIVLRISGRSKDEPILIAAYGDPALPRPKLERTPREKGNITIRGSNLIIIDLDLAGLKVDSGIVVAAGAEHLTFEGLTINGYSFGLKAQAKAGNPIQYLTVRRCVISDSGGPGVFLKNVDDLTIEECVMDNNGTKKKRHHNIYKARGGARHVYRNNIISRGANHGLKIRARAEDYQIVGNLFVRNRNDMGITLDGDDISRGNLEWDCHNINVVGNVFLETGRHEGSMAMYVSHVDRLTIERNWFVNSQSNPTSATIVLFHGHDLAITKRSNVRIIANVIAGFSNNGIAWSGPKGVDHTGTGNEIRDNLIQLPKDGRKRLFALRGFGMSDLSEKIALSGNVYYVDRPMTAGWIKSGGPDGLTLAQWQARSAEADAEAAKVTFRDPTRTTGTYNATLGGPATADAFIEEARQQRKDHWRTAYSPAAVIAYIAEGFTEVSRTPIQ